MSSRFGASLSAAAGRAPGLRLRSGKGAMSEKEVYAYLLARDAVRRIQRVSPLFVPRNNQSARARSEPEKGSLGGPFSGQAGHQ
jgi:hypothetical protein